MLQFEITLWRLAVKRYLKNDEPTYTEPPKGRHTHFATFWVNWWSLIVVGKGQQESPKSPRTQVIVFAGLQSYENNLKPFTRAIMYKT